MVFVDYCINCGADLLDDMEVCAECGAPRIGRRPPSFSEQAARLSHGEPEPPRAPAPQPAAPVFAPEPEAEPEPEPSFEVPAAQDEPLPAWEPDAPEESGAPEESEEIASHISPQAGEPLDLFAQPEESYSDIAQAIAGIEPVREEPEEQAASEEPASDFSPEPEALPEEAPLAPAPQPEAGEWEVPEFGESEAFYEDDPAYAALSTTQYALSIVLMAIPVVGWIVALIWSLGGSQNLNRRSMARAWVLVWVFAAALVALVLFIGTYFFPAWVSGLYSRIYRAWQILFH